MTNSIFIDVQTATSIDVKAKKVILDGGKDAVSYDKLVLASGGLPRKLPIDGADLENVYVLRGVQHAQEIDAGKLHLQSAHFGH